MAIEKLTALEARVRDLLALVQSLKRENEALRSELRAARERLLAQQTTNARWASERADIKARIEKVLDELDALEFAGDVPCGE